MQETEVSMDHIKDTSMNCNNLTPAEFFLSQNYPNPFSGETSIKYCVAYRTRVRLQIFNTYGELIKQLVDEEKDMGTYEYKFDTALCRSLRGGHLREGTYICQFQAGDYLRQIEMVYSSKRIKYPEKSEINN
jgi:hypothetical protein